MKITGLIENTACKDGLACEHGLSLYIETEKHRIMFDFGETGSFAENAAALDVDVSSADIAFLSHGHYDHGGAMGKFFELNDKASVYAHKLAFEPHLAYRDDGKTRDIGVDSALLDSGRIILVDGVTVIDDELTVYSGVTARELWSETNKKLLMQGENGPEPDSFEHEHNLIITENGKTVLISGCSHNGIVNLLEKAIQIIGKAPDVVVAGFHLSNPGGSEDGLHIPVEETAHRLLKYPSMFYTCHCTGLPSYERMKEIMGDRLEYMSGGTVIEVK